MAPKTTAQRQAEYRAKRGDAGIEGNGQRRVNMWVDTEVFLALERLSVHYGLTKQEMISRLIKTEDDRVLASLDIDSTKWDEYFAALGSRQ